ncbi:LysE family translocator [Rhizobiaceae bacterium n13]|uniref:LysE family translocator n=1 Tax=Ferirhizobium litorale TaxID=2927786 RepID=A0AAE3QD41_9HYPH|nr:LysE family translocator [Fererhizobium litorale]MDI7860871.1 LysE family translocator [Fererhizobium litorale]MDI7921019.1 LysE family translocator [Fererhizobium litorale]
MMLEFALTSLIVIATPGTGALYTIAMGLGHGRRAAIIASLGCTAGIVPHMAAAMLGLAAVLATNETAFNLVKTAGVAYLIYMAVTIWRDRSLLAPSADERPRSTFEIIRHAVLINLLNPKLSLFFLALLPQFVGPSDENALISMLGYSLVFMVLTFIVFALYGIFAAAARQKVLASSTVTNWLRRSFAAGFLVLGIRLAIPQP